MKRVLVWGAVLVTVVAGLSATTGWLSVLDRPEGSEVGTWRGEHEVLLVDGGWAMVRLTGWVRATEVAPDAPQGERILGSPGGGLWVRDVTTRTDFVGDVQLMGRIVNATGQDYSTLLIEVVTLDSAGNITSVMPAMITALPSGSSKAFSIDTMTKPRDVHDWELQYGGGF